MKMLVYPCILIVFVTSSSFGDWQPGEPHKMHFAQLPNLMGDGLNVLNGPYAPVGTQAYQKFLADDFMCTQSGPVTDIHIWGSWNSDNNPENITKSFQLAIFSNIPATETTPSHPGELLWARQITPVEQLFGSSEEGFYDPNPDEIIGSDSEVWQYNFDIPTAEAFNQQEGSIYWLGATLVGDVDDSGIVDEDDVTQWQGSLEPYNYGWKSSVSQWEDDAVWTEIDPFGPYVPIEPAWNELRDPRSDESLDLAFVITPEPATFVLMGMGGVLVLSGIRRRNSGG